ncbi:Liver-expressed antimicrobial peptide 2 [Saguinus oedipus]|uniref:Liver-expressed antimicrobial peptide 2 n=1 Tax=Saguinus oedipus TaxID=9490 RepID=A0ABQ9WA81_SAGOE|nr:Liver-expressed antimicrobial peptide 2 [Saguinus oedipus]
MQDSVLQHPASVKMCHLKLCAVLMIFLLLLGQVRRDRYHLGNDHSSKVCGRVSTLPCLDVFALQINGSPIPEVSSAKRRPRRMTPFWRGVSLRPIGASCRDDSECITRLCRYSTNLGAGLGQRALGS